MRLFFLIILILITFACSDDSNPSVQPNLIDEVIECSYAGSEIIFIDSCSYSFIVTFLTKIDSAEVLYKNLGATFYFYIESNDYNYWINYFTNDTTIQNISSYTISDSLILAIETSGERTNEEEEIRFRSINNLTLQRIEESLKRVTLFINRKNIGETEIKLKNYDFVFDAFSVMICQGG